MKHLYLYALAVMVILASCRKKDNDIGNPVPDPPGWSNNDSTTVTFPKDTIGLTELYGSYEQTIPTFIVSRAKSSGYFSYEIVGGNGLKKSSDTTVAGRGQVDEKGYAAVYVPGLNNYKDGVITVVMKLENPDTTITAKFYKWEYAISRYTDFMRMGFYLHGDTAAHYVQTGDIAFPDTVFTGSPTVGYLYGSYDGQGYKITNLTIRSQGTPPGTTSDVGLFIAGFRGSVIKNVKLELSEEGITSTGPGNYGGLVGSLYENSYVINCSVEGNITVSKTIANTIAGGITGLSNGGNIIGCSFRGNVSANIAGGIAGLSETPSEVNMCYAYAGIDGVNAGGIVGTRTGRLNVSNSYAVATTYPATFMAIAPVAQNQVVVTNSFANTGTGQAGVTIATIPDMNTGLAAMTITEWPLNVPRPANNKPYKYDTAPTSPMKLWWE